MGKKICYVTTLAVTMKGCFIPQIKYLKEYEYDVYAVCSPDETIQEELGEDIHYIPIKIERGVHIRTLKNSIDNLTKLFKEEKFDFVQYSTPNAAFCAAIAAKRAKIKIRNYHLMGFRYLGFKGIKRQIFKFVEKITCFFSTHIECVSLSNLSLGIKEKIFPEKKACVIGNGSTGGIDLQRFDAEKRTAWRKEIREALGYKDQDFIFGFAGRITRDKGINELLQAFLYIEHKCNMLLIGTKEGLDTLDQNILKKAQEDGRIRFLDRVNDIEKYYAAMDVLVLPSWREGFGMVIAEAAAMGTPAIVSRIPGPIDVISDGETALTVNVKDAEDLKEKMELLFHNRDLLNDLAMNGIVFTRDKFDSVKLFKKIAERKEDLLSEK